MKPIATAVISFILFFLSFGCYRCDEPSDFRNYSINLTLLDAETGNNLLGPLEQGTLLPPAQIFRDGIIDETSLNLESIIIDDWDTENIIDDDREYDEDRLYQIEYEIHFLNDTIEENIINIDTLNVSYTIFTTSCDYPEIDQLTINYNNENIYNGRKEFNIVASI